MFCKPFHTMLFRLERKNGSDDETKEKVKEKKTMHGEKKTKSEEKRTKSDEKKTKSDEKKTTSEEKRRSSQKELSWMLGLGLVLYCLDSLPRW